MPRRGNSLDRVIGPSGHRAIEPCQWLNDPMPGNSSNLQLRSYAITNHSITQWLDHAIRLTSRSSRTIVRSRRPPPMPNRPSRPTKPHRPQPPPPVFRAVVVPVWLGLLTVLSAGGFAVWSALLWVFWVALPCGVFWSGALVWSFAGGV